MRKQLDRERRLVCVDQPVVRERGRGPEDTEIWTVVNCKGFNRDNDLQAQDVII